MDVANCHDGKKNAQRTMWKVKEEEHVADEEGQN
jgi:hypothetical protein